MVDSLTGLVWNRDERRLRAPVRLVAAVVLVALVVLATGVVFGLLGLGRLLTELLGSTAGSLATGLVSSLVAGLAIVVAVALAGYGLDRRTFSDFGFHLDRSWWLDLGFGLGLGVALMTLIFVTGVAAGWFRVTGFLVGDAVVGGLATLVALFLFVGVYEELFARGYLLTNVAEGLTGYVGERGAVAVSVLVSSGVFGLLHASNPNASLLSTVTITLAGVMLALGYVLTDELAIPIGVHITWNLFQGGVYGFPVSGLNVNATVVATSEQGPDLVTGGSFGPEAGLLGVAAMVVGSLAIVGWVRWRYGTVGIHPGLTTPELRTSSRSRERSQPRE
jgi:hypothetical protein